MKKRINKPRTIVQQPVDNFWTKPEIVIEVEKNLNKWKNS
jgi:hypothetical protein